MQGRNFEGLDAHWNIVWSETPRAVDVRGSAISVHMLPAVKEQRQPFAMGAS